MGVSSMKTWRKYHEKNTCFRVRDCKLFNSMRYFFDNYLTYIPVCFPQVKVFEAACEALRVVAERERQCRHYVR